MLEPEIQKNHTEMHHLLPDLVLYLQKTLLDSTALIIQVLSTNWIAKDKLN